MAINERRNTYRLPVEMAITEEYGSTVQDAIAVNISEHGMHYHRPNDSVPRKDKEVMLTFSLTKSLKPIKVLSWVVQERVVDDKIATHVTFMFLPEKDEELIRDFVASQDNRLLN